MPDTYTYKSPKTGKSYDYDWNKPTPPTPDDFKQLEKMVDDEESTGDRDTTMAKAIVSRSLGFGGEIPGKPGKSHGPLIDAIWNIPSQIGEGIKEFAHGAIESMPVSEQARGWEELKALREGKKVPPAPTMDEILKPVREAPLSSGIRTAVNAVVPTAGYQYDIAKGAVQDFAKGNLGGGILKGGLTILPFLGGKGAVASSEAATIAKTAAETAKRNEVLTKFNEAAPDIGLPEPMAGRPPFIPPGMTGQFGLRNRNTPEPIQYETITLSNGKTIRRPIIREGNTSTYDPLATVPETLHPPQTNVEVMNALLPDRFKTVPTARFPPSGEFAEPARDASGRFTPPTTGLPAEGIIDEVAGHQIIRPGEEFPTSGIRGTGPTLEPKTPKTMEFINEADKTPGSHFGRQAIEEFEQRFGKPKPIEVVKTPKQKALEEADMANEFEGQMYSGVKPDLETLKKLGRAVRGKAQFEIVDKKTGEVVGYANTKTGARKSVDTRDNAYGGYRYGYREAKLSDIPELPPAGTHELNAGAKPDFKNLLTAEQKKLLTKVLGKFQSEEGGIIGGPKEPTAEPIAPRLRPVNTDEPYGQLVEAIRGAKKYTRTQEEATSADRARKAYLLAKNTTPGMKGYIERAGLLKGSGERIITEPLKITNPQLDSFLDAIKNNPDLKQYEKHNTQEAVIKLREGKVLQDSEIGYLEKAFGSGVGKEIRDLYAGLPFELPKAEKVYDVLNSAKAINSFGEMSFGFRQGLGMAHTKPFWTSWKTAVKAGLSDEFYTARKTAIEADKMYPVLKKQGLAITDIEKLAGREDQFVSKFAEKIPVLGHLIKANHRAASTFLNEIRFQNTKNLLKNAKDMGLDPAHNAALTKEIIDYVNTATGRGSLGKLEAVSGPLNLTFYSPRLIASRVKMLNPFTYKNASPFVRRQYLKSLGAIIGTGVATNILGNLSGGKTELNPLSSDFLKTQFGDERVDSLGGFQQYVVALSRILSGKSETLTGKEFELGSRYGTPTRKDKLVDFFGNKLSPGASLFWDWMNGSEYNGAPIEWKSKVIESVAPLFWQDVYELAKDDPNMLPLAIPGFAGIGMQNLGDTGGTFGKDVGKNLLPFIPEFRTGGRKQNNIPGMPTPPKFTVPKFNR